MTELDITQAQIDHPYCALCYESSVGDRIKQVWFAFQAISITYYGILGIRKHKHIKGHYDEHTRFFCLQIFIILLFLANAYSINNVSLYYVAILLASYQAFIAFLMILKSCPSAIAFNEEDREGLGPQCRMEITRWTVHLLYIVLLIGAFNWRELLPLNCEKFVFPMPFLFLMFVNLFLHILQVYTATQDYYMDFSQMDAKKPRIHDFIDNEKLFKKQMSWFLKLNIVFGILSGSMIAYAFFDINHDFTPILSCYDQYHWYVTGVAGNVYQTLQMMIITMQVSLCQIVMIRVPASQGLFDEETIHKEGFLCKDPDCDYCRRKSMIQKEEKGDDEAQVAVAVGEKVDNQNDDFAKAE